MLGQPQLFVVLHLIIRLEKWLSLLDSLTKDKILVAFFVASFHGYPLFTNGIVTFSRAVKSLSKLFC